MMTFENIIVKLSERWIYNKKLVSMKAEDVPITYADTSALERDFEFKPNTI